MEHLIVNGIVEFQEVERNEYFKKMYGAENVEWTSRDTLSIADRLRIQKWRFPPNDKLYIEYKQVYQDSLYYNQVTGEINWLTDDGFFIWIKKRQDHF